MNNMISSVATFIAMGTVNTITLFNRHDDVILSRIFQYVKVLESKLTVHQSDSEVMAINRNAGIRSVKVSDAVFILIQRALTASLDTESGFNFTIGPLTKLWRQHQTQQTLPNSDEISTALSLIDPYKVVINSSEKSVFLEQQLMSIDLGAIAKGYIADGIKRLLIKAGIEQAMIDLGGNIVALGESPKQNNGYWRVGIQKPFAMKGEYIGIVNLKNQSVVTSGIYERYVDINNHYYHHIINSKTGYPFKNEFLSVTIISNKSIDGEIYSTIVYAKGKKEGIEFITKQKEMLGILIDKENHLFVSRSLIPFFELKDDKYQVIAI